MREVLVQFLATIGLFFMIANVILTANQRSKYSIFTSMTVTIIECALFFLTGKTVWAVCFVLWAIICYADLHDSDL